MGVRCFRDGILICFPAFKRTACCGRVLVVFLGFFCFFCFFWSPVISWPAVAETILRHPFVQSQTSTQPQRGLVGRAGWWVQIIHNRTKIMTPPPSRDDKLDRIKSEAGGGGGGALGCRFCGAARG